MLYIIINFECVISYILNEKKKLNCYNNNTQI